MSIPPSNFLLIFFSTKVLLINEKYLKFPQYLYLVNKKIFIDLKSINPKIIIMPLVIDYLSIKQAKKLKMKLTAVDIIGRVIWKFCIFILTFFIIIIILFF